MHNFATSNLLVNHTIFNLVEVSLNLKFFLCSYIFELLRCWLKNIDVELGASTMKFVDVLAIESCSKYLKFFTSNC